MAALVESMAHFNAMPWHGESTPASDPYNVGTTIREAGLDWRVGLEALYTSGLVRVPNNSLYREVNGKREHLDTVGPDYTPVQNSEAFAFFQPWLTSGQVTLECAGSLDGGKRVFVLGKCDIDDSDVRAGDPVRPYILLSNPHQNAKAVHVGFSAVRVVCMNTLRAAIADKASQLIRVRHNSRVLTNLDTVRETMDVARQQFAATAEQYRKLAAKGISAVDVTAYVRQVLDLTPAAKLTPTAEAMLSAIYSGKGNSGGTLWDAYNGVTEVLSWKQGQLSSLWFGANARLSQKAYDLALSLAV